MNDILELFDGILLKADDVYPANHPLAAYYDEIKAMDRVLDQAGNLLNKSFIKNQWLELYDSLLEWKKHLSRKQNQLYPVLERVGFDLPTKIMWTFDDEI